MLPNGTSIAGRTSSFVLHLWSSPHQPTWTSSPVPKDCLTLKGLEVSRGT
jgi:hypothetical protein